MDAHTNFDPHAFGRGAAVDIYGATVAIASAFRAAVANAQAIADIQATQMTVEQWHATVQALMTSLVSAHKHNAALTTRVCELTDKAESQAFEIRTLRALI